MFLLYVSSLIKRMIRVAMIMTAGTDIEMLTISLSEKSKVYIG